MSDPTQQPPGDPYQPQPPYQPQAPHGQTPPPPSPPAQAPPPYGHPPHGQAPYGYYQPQPIFAQPRPLPPSHPQATTSMVLGIVSLLGGCSLVLPIFVAPAAWIVGAKAVREIDASGGALGGRAEANTGKITGIIGTVLLILMIVALVVVVIVAIAVEGSDSTDYDKYALIDLVSLLR